MPRMNLSTRPFYNERGVHLVLGLCAVVLIGLTAYSTFRIVSLSREDAALAARVASADVRAAELKIQALALRSQADRKQLEAVTASAAEANSILDRRLFSWTHLLNRFETTLPADVRINAIRPDIRREGDVRLVLTAAARSVEDVDRFMENLEASGEFSQMLSRQEFYDEDGLLQVVLQGRYRPGRQQGAGEQER
jgi:Tfp pilus assembly protein PilN